MKNESNPFNIADIDEKVITLYNSTQSSISPEEAMRKFTALKKVSKNSDLLHIVCERREK